MNFEFFSVEGDPPCKFYSSFVWFIRLQNSNSFLWTIAARGCPAAALRIWTAPDTDHAPIELCGDKLAGDIWHYLSDAQAARISFITTDKTIGAQVRVASNYKQQINLKLMEWISLGWQGFQIVWTEVQDTPQLSGAQSIDKHHCDSAYLFRCTISKYCIASKLHCDKVKNCGPGDESDELNCESWVSRTV